MWKMSTTPPIRRRPGINKRLRGPTCVMKSRGRTLLFMAFLVSFFSPLGAAPTINVPAGIDTKPWDALLKKYIDEQGAVAYEKWKNDAADMKALDAFLDRYAPAPTQPAKDAEEISGL